jgi:hypothetical protein
VHSLWLLFRKSEAKPKKIVIVSQHGHGRVLKIANALNIENIRPILITGNTSYLDNELFDKVLVCTGALHAFHIAAQNFKGSVFHIICIWDYLLASLMILFKIGRIIVDPFDVLNFFVKPAIKKKYSIQMALEKWCLTRSDGLVCRDLRTNLLKKNNWALPPRILFMDYIAKPSQGYKVKKLGRDIVYLGNVELDPSNNVAYQYGLVDILCENNIRLDIFPSLPALVNNLRLKFSHLCPFASQNGYLFVHDTIPAAQISGAISAFSYGLLISTKAVDFHDFHDTYRPVMGRYFFAGKLFDYYESGVFPIAQHGMFVNFVMRRMGVGVSVGSYEDIVAYVIKNENRNVVFKYNTKLTLEHNAPRLAEFYKVYLEI